MTPPDDSLPDLGPAAMAVAALVDRVTPDQLDDPTPCPDYAVRNVLGHLSGLSLAFRDAALKNVGPTTDTDPGASLPDIGDDWRPVLAARLTELPAAWRSPGAWEGMTQAGGVTFPAADAGVVALNELVVHGWDLARATGQPYAPEPADLEVAYTMLSAAAESGEETGGMFGPPVPVGENASLLDQVISLSGRDPAWTP
ncbi:TIGR03086 family metal-binding protein [Streptomyces sp. T7(2022)]|uniref:TIGR03086 family metal-binding protein n=1 Tax=Streptomyces sp. T7(2022) TaxID=2916034 RepID=UPI001EE47609|nr:TIGR03086 family metal-binding protein [Streptomyces sp. T7(2022)]MCG5122257.1 TIGR03086 family metal-binding protein [Streptomyces sp. T7(2022)]